MYTAHRVETVQFVCRNYAFAQVSQFEVCLVFDGRQPEMSRRLINQGFRAGGDCKSPGIVWRLGACLLRVSAQARDVVLDLGLSFEFIHGWVECVCVYYYYIYIYTHTYYTCVYIYTVYRYLDRKTDR